ncbi:MAG: HAMP domain-containing histidine kinase [Clostridiales bacterium]|nr:HAMP domain-containing histidine kinase [Clostridiales bacterium]
MFLGRSSPMLAAGGILLLSVIYIILFSSLSMELDRIKKGAQELASGNMEYKLTGHRMSFTREIAENLNRIGDGLQEAVSVQTRSERLKSELITNVSHDIKTPLTSIINYVDLLKKESVCNETDQSYLDILDKKSLRLKDLTEDLIEASKASTGNLNVAYTRLNGKELVNQAVGEYKERFEQRGLEVIVNLPEADLTLWADGRHTFRILENMLSNACKYSLEKSRVYVDLFKEDGMGYIIVKNISGRPLNITEEELMQRFVRGDSSRSTQGSGLGLSIALSLAELQGGEFKIKIDGDLFKAVASFQLPEAQQI